MRYVLHYTSAPDGLAKIAEVFPAHQARWHEFRDRGELLLIGPYSDRSGAMAVFTTREAAEAFATGDPFVTEGVIGEWTVQEWMEAIGDA